MAGWRAPARGHAQQCDGPCVAKRLEEVGEIRIPCDANRPREGHVAIRHLDGEQEPDCMQ